jgi:hypothetical protein
VNVVRVRISATAHGEAAALIVDEHLSAAAGELPWLPVADVIVCPDASPYGLGEGPGLLTRYPGCLIVACARVGGGAVVLGRDGQVEAFEAVDPLIIGSAAHAWTVAGRPIRELDSASITVTDPRQAPPGDAGPAPLRVRRVR